MGWFDRAFLYAHDTDPCHEKEPRNKALRLVFVLPEQLLSSDEVPC